MNTLKQILIEQIGYEPTETQMSFITMALRKWLIRKRQEREGNDFSKERFQTLAFYDSLLEELKNEK